MANINFTIDDAKLPRIIDAMKGLYPIPTDENGDPQFSDTAWAKEAVRIWVRNQVARWEQSVAQKAIQFSPENDIIT